MKKLPRIVRNKVIDIGNAILKKANLEEEILITIAVSHAKKWTINQGIIAGTVPKKLANKR